MSIDKYRKSNRIDALHDSVNEFRGEAHKIKSILNKMSFKTIISFGYIKLNSNKSFIFLPGFVNVIKSFKNN